MSAAQMFIAWLCADAAIDAVREGRAGWAAFLALAAAVNIGMALR